MSLVPSLLLITSWGGVPPGRLAAGAFTSPRFGAAVAGLALAGAGVAVPRTPCPPLSVAFFVECSGVGGSGALCSRPGFVLLVLGILLALGCQVA